MKTVAVFFGGRSSEREISVITGMLAVNLLRRTSYRVIPVYITPSLDMVSSDKMKSPEDFRGEKKFGRVCLERGGVRIERKKAAVDVALNCCHGGMGEDGTLSAILNFYKIPLASPDVAPSAVFMDKLYTKFALTGLGIPVVPYFSVFEREWRESADAVLARAERFGYPAIVKPARLGSSIGIKVAADPSELGRALDLCFRLDGCAVVERYLKEKRDLNCAVFRREGRAVPSPVEEVFSQEEILTFSEKYEGRAGRTNKLPAEIGEALKEEIEGYALKIYDSFGIRGVIRADFLLSGETLYLGEVNTVPGSLACYLFGKSLSENRAFLLSLLEETLRRPQTEKEVVETGILSSKVFAKGKRV